MTIERAKVSDLALFATVFVTGACVLVIELMGTRVMAPFYGSGIYTWSALIAVTLAALALGYAFGGRLADRRPQPVILFGLSMAAGLWTLFTPFIARHLLSYLAPLLELRTGVLASSLVLFSPNLFLLGAIGPFVIRLVTSSETVIGSRSGMVFAVSTVGSLAGALGTGFFLVPNYGVQTIFSVCGLLLMMISGLGFLYLRRPLVVLALPFFALPLLNAGPVPPATINILAQQSSFYGQLQVVEKDRMRVLLVDGIGQNYSVQNDLYNIRYLNFLSSLVTTRIAKSGGVRNRMLLIGAGAGHLPKLLANTNVEMDIVELDADAIELAKTWFGFSAAQNRVHIADGRRYLEQDRSSYDQIIIDAFSSDQVAVHLLTKEALMTTLSRLSPHGLLAINVTSTISGKDVSAIYQTLRAVFGNVHAYSPASDTSKLTSIVFVASRKHETFAIESSLLQFRQVVDSNAFLDGELDQPSGGVVVTDDYNPLGHYRSGVRSLWRDAMQKFLGQEELQWMLF